MLSWALALTLALGCSACDSSSGQPSPERGEVVGEWEAIGDLQADLATISRRVQTIDLQKPGTGELRFSGSASGSVRFVQVWRRDDGQKMWTVFTMLPFNHPFPNAYSFVSLGEGQVGVTAWADHAAGVYKQYASPVGGPPAYTYRDGTITVPRTTLTSYDGAVVTIEGTLKVPMRTLEANREHEMVRHLHAFDPGEFVRLSVRADSTFEQFVSDGRDSSRLTGMWRRLDEGAMQFSARGLDGILRTSTAELAFENGHMLTGITRDRCTASGAQCLRYTEQTYDLPEGSISTARQRNAYVFRRVR